LAPAPADQPGTAIDSHTTASATGNLAEPGIDALHRDNFMAQLAPQAERAAAQLGVPVQALLAQAALETGWGEKMIQRDNGSNSFNLFGIKADARWRGERATVVTSEYYDGRALRVRADFRAYDSYQQSFDDYVAFLRDNPRYRAVFENRHDVSTFASALQRAGYATDPDYAQKIDAIARHMGDAASPAYTQLAALAASSPPPANTATVQQP
ncbi:MAG: flagellar assembly peptidoglycan hydrolase FlgJ, partial [Gammaproteobacteria bacterium]|nr:flagellar assembly peptidoglycan hydrolase FlgJ [Gammaproteobacteria bacterium]